MITPFHDDVLQDIHKRHRNAPTFHPGQLVMFDGNGQWWPMIIERVALNHFADAHGYVLKSIDFPMAKDMMSHPNYLRPMIRTRAEMKQLLKVV